MLGILQFPPAESGRVIAESDPVGVTSHGIDPRRFASLATSPFQGEDLHDLRADR